MPEGLDQVSDVFRAELNPQGDRPRDDGGRFAAVSRPETMFEPRPIEGDPLTGDMRDGGEDARLAAAERRIADGRAEQGDEGARRAAAEGEGESGQRSLQRRSQERGDAAADEGHERAEALAERRRSQEPQNQDDGRADGGAEAAAERGDADGSSEPDAEAQKWQVSYEGKPVEKLEVTVDGQTVPVTLGECVRGYMRTATFHKRLNLLDQARQFLEREAVGIAQARDYYTQKLQYVDRLIGELTPTQPNWDQEFAQDPRAAHLKQKAFAEIYGRQQFLQAEIARTAQEGAQDYDQRVARYANEQKAQFVAEANLHDNNAYNAEMQSMRNYAQVRGFGEGEIATVYDKRMLHVLRDATKYNQMMTARPKAVIAGAGKTLTPGVATPAGNGTRRSLDDAMRKLAKTGRTDDAAIVFQRLIR